MKTSEASKKTGLGGRRASANNEVAKKSDIRVFTNNISPYNICRTVVELVYISHVYANKLV